MRLVPCTFLTLLLGSALIAAGADDAPFLSPLSRTPQEAARIAEVTTLAAEFTAPHRFEALSGGAASVPRHLNAAAFSQVAPNLPLTEGLDFEAGRAMFEKLWVSSPTSTLASDGLGPLFNARSCHGCHINNGRGLAPEGPDDLSGSLVLRLSRPAEDLDQIAAYLASLPDPVYGAQVQDAGLAGHRAEGQIDVAYDILTVPLAGGETAELRAPRYGLRDLAYGPLHPDTETSARVAPPMIGLGLLEAIPAEDILSRADPEDLNADGISGRAHFVWSPDFEQPLLGRFGWKAGVANLRMQAAAALHSDIGLSTAAFPDPWGDCTDGQTACRTAPHGDGDQRIYEVGTTGLDLLTLYSRNLAVPRRADTAEPVVLQGKQIFYATGCPACHQPSFVTHRLPDQPAQSFQLIWPYTDLLLHDMGPGLANAGPEGGAAGSEWRTPPLWGIGLTEQVSGAAQFLHDGRARSLLEAILWHGGEAEAQRDAIVDMTPEQRHALITFLESL